MEDPARLDDSDNWCGGFYELNIELGPADSSRLQLALTALWSAAGIEGCYPDPRRGLTAQVPLTPEALAANVLLAGVVRIPSGDSIVCACSEVTYADNQQQWLCLNLPICALLRTDPRIGSFPFGPAGELASLAWRRPLDAWLATVADAVHRAVPIKCARIGFDLNLWPDAAMLAEGLADDRWEAVALPGPGGLVYTPAIR